MEKLRKLVSGQVSNGKWKHRHMFRKLWRQHIYWQQVLKVLSRAHSYCKPGKTCLLQVFWLLRWLFTFVYGTYPSFSVTRVTFNFVFSPSSHSFIPSFRFPTRKARRKRRCSFLPFLLILISGSVQERKEERKRGRGTKKNRTKVFNNLHWNSLPSFCIASTLDASLTEALGMRAPKIRTYAYVWHFKLWTKHSRAKAIE